MVIFKFTTIPKAVSQKCTYPRASRRENTSTRVCAHIYTLTLKPQANLIKVCSVMHTNLVLVNKKFIPTIKTDKISELP